MEAAANGSLAIGLDGGAIAGAVVAPSLDWSPHRARVVLAGTLAKPNTTTDVNSNIVAGAMTAGGFALCILMTKQSAPDPRFSQPKATTTAASAANTPTSFIPWVGDRGQLGLLAGGTF